MGRSTSAVKVGVLRPFILRVHRVVEESIQYKWAKVKNRINQEEKLESTLCADIPVTKPLTNCIGHSEQNTLKTENRKNTKFYISPTLKKAVQKYLLISFVDWDILEQGGVSAIEVKCPSTASIEKLLSNAIGYHKAINNFCTILPPPAPLGEFSLTVPVGEFLPNVFDDLLSDIANTDLFELEINDNLVAAAEGYVATFHSEEIVHIRFVTSPEHNLNVLVDNEMKEAYRGLLDVLTGLLAEIDPSTHVVLIRNDLSFRIDGHDKQLQARAERALLVLAQLSTKNSFTTEEFMTLYQRDIGEHRKDFGNIMKKLQTYLPKLRWAAKQGHRTMTGLKMRVDATDEQIMSAIQKHYRKQPAK